MLIYWAVFIMANNFDFCFLPFNSAGFSPIRQLNVGLFKTQIQQILTRNTSTPLLRWVHDL